MGATESVVAAVCHASPEVADTPGSVAHRGPHGSLGGFLERFRGTGGVPAAVADDAALELVPVFVALEEVERAAAEAYGRADRIMARRRFEAEEGAREILADAARLADSERGDALKAGLRAADVEASRIVALAEEDARRIGEIARGRLPRLVDEVVARVLEED